MSDELSRPLSAVAGGVQEVAALAAEGEDVRELVESALDALASAVRYERAVYLSCENGKLWPRLVRPEGPLGQESLDVAGHPALRELFDAGSSVELPDASVDGLRVAVELVTGTRPSTVPVILVPVRRGEDPEALLVVAREAGDEAGPAVLQIATVFGALIGLGVAAIHRAHRLEQLREALEERNAFLSEEISADADACHALEASVSRPMRRLVQMAKQVAATDAPVLITGETGTGKEVLARAIHEWSARPEGPFVQLNCAALPDNLIESELFGHVKGAFSGAVRDRPGRFRVADGGTLLLDEIGEMPIEAQAKLLRVLEEGEIVPVGSDRTLRVDVRVIAATNVDLELAIDRARFREDLYFRLHVFPLHIPPLRERSDDLPVLIEQILARIRRRTGHGPWRVTEATLKELRNYPWPGNVRELVNALERARVFSPMGGTLRLDVGGDGVASRRRAAGGRRTWPTLAEHQKQYIEEVLRRTEGKIYGPGGAAELLDLAPSTLQSRMKKLGVDR